jgi:uncharacterized OB-fold protein
MSADTGSRSVVEGVFTVDPPRLLGARCDHCGNHHFPRLGQCPYCGADGVRPVELSDHGTLWGWTTVTAPPPGYLGEVPYGFGVVALPEGLLVVTRLASPEESWDFGQPMHLRVVVLGPDADGTRVLTWEFAP